MSEPSPQQVSSSTPNLERAERTTCCYLSSSSTQFCEIYIMRHGETDWNQQGIFQGHTDIPLNAQGEEQALSLRSIFQHIPFSCVYTSDLMRAKRTAKIVVSSSPLHENVKIYEHSKLRERCMASWEGKSIADWRQYISQLSTTPNRESTQEQVLNFKWDSGVESYGQAFSRLRSFIEEIVHNHWGQTILLSTHGGILGSVLYSLNFQMGRKWRVSNCAWIKIRVSSNLEFSVLDHHGVELESYPHHH
ncbi:hypothetical protein FDP41_008094 [Naegleria fowleri]|uniref:Phosphoglycerate mutase n=1 Tax=Naegleria fowleri TaxID=5763 RepID=A0A6A5BHB2_NAEFO|nr:uncharacterized protein FDP41_008094 [Naegleria fowleri]KAF0973390.1 hypothetical protein FDP41_008094 [Naegleria fowleri]CAG4710845.1 unnamed protein product [Naegleria fowleri]